MEKYYNPLEEQSDVDVKHAQVVYLSEVLNKALEFISEVTGYAYSTVKSYIKKYKDLLTWAKEIFTKKAMDFFPFLGKRKGKYDNKIFVAEGINLLDDAKQKCYLVSFYDEDDNLVCSKVGTTTKTIIGRIKQELGSSTYKNRGCVKVKINRVYDCEEVPAEGLESYFRAMYIRKFPDKFNKNDRFFDVEFDLEQADKFVLEYFLN